MFKRWSLCLTATALALAVCPGGVSAAAPELPNLAVQDIPSAAVVRKMTAPVTRQATVNALLADNLTRSQLLEIGKKAGLSEIQILGAANTAIQTNFTRVATTDPAEAAYRAINWSAGVSFTPKSVPTYGTSTRVYRLGYVVLHPVKEATFMEGLDYARLYFNPSGFYDLAVIVALELPTEPAIYAVTIKAANLDGEFMPGWLTPKQSGARPPVALKYIEKPPGAPGPKITNVTLTTLPDKTGFVGLISANPDEPLYPGNPFGTRKLTAQFVLQVDSDQTRPSEPLTTLLFRRITITRL